MTLKIVNLIGKLPTHPSLRYPSRPTAGVYRLALHHTATPAWATPEQIARFHVEARGWPGIAYPFLVDQQATIFKCWPLSTLSYCVGHGNTPTLCVCMIGNFHDLPRLGEPATGDFFDFMTWAARAGVIPQEWRARAILAESHGVPGSLQWEATIELCRNLISAYRLREAWGHREVPTIPPQTTACPGRFVDLVEFRRRLQPALDLAASLGDDG